MATTVARLQAVLSAHTGDFDRAMARSETKMQKVGRVAGVAGVAVAAGIAYGLEKSVHAAINAQKEQARLEVAFHNAGKSIGPYEKAIGQLEGRSRRLGFTDEQTKRSLGSLITVTHSYAQSAREVAIAQDLARFKGVDLEQATKALTMAHAGSLRALKQLGLDVPKVTDAQDRLKHAVKDHTTEAYKNALAEAKQQDKAATLKNVLETVTKATHGQAQAYSDTAAGGMAQFSAQMEHIEVAIGSKLLPALTKAIQYVMDHWPQISKTIEEGWQQVRPIFIAFGQLAVSVVQTIQRHWNTIGPIVRQVVGIVKTQLQIMAGAIRFFTDILRGDWGAAWGELKGIVGRELSLVKRQILLMKDVLVAAMSAVSHAMWSAVSKAFEDAWASVKGAVSGLFHKIVGWIKDFLGIKSPSTVFHEIGQNMIKGLINGIGSMGGALKDYVINTAKHAVTSIPGAIGGALGIGRTHGGGAHMDHLVAKVVNAVQFARTSGAWHGEVTSGFRTYDEQARLYQRYLHGGPLAAKPGTSSHEFGQAVDVSDPGGFQRAMNMLPLGQRLFNRLGARDPVHFSVSGYDKGGWLMPGATLAVNNTGRPERVVSGNGDNVVIPISLGGEHIATIVFDMLRRKAKVFENRNGRPAFGGA